MRRILSCMLLAVTVLLAVPASQASGAASDAHSLSGKQPCAFPIAGRCLLYYRGTGTVWYAEQKCTFGGWCIYDQITFEAKHHWIGRYFNETGTWVKAKHSYLVTFTYSNGQVAFAATLNPHTGNCLLYTSDAADE